MTAAHCAAVSKTRPVYSAPGWTVKCVLQISGWPSNVIGLTIPSSRTILLRVNQVNVTNTLAHELAHAYSVDRLTNAQRAYFSRRLSEPGFFFGSSYFSSPAESWANNQARCAGYYQGVPGVKYRYVSCQVLRDTIAYSPVQAVAAPIRARVFVQARRVVDWRH